MRRFFKSYFVFLNRLSVLLFGCLFSIHGFSQLSVSVGYAYLHNRELDKVIQLYNTARPWQDNKLYPLTHTAEAAVGWNWCLHQKRQLHFMPQLGYGRTASAIRNGEDKMSTGFHRADIFLQFRFHPRALIKGVQSSGPMGPRWFMTAGPGYSLIQPFVRTNGESLEIDDERYKPKSFTFFASAGIGYHLVLLKSRFIITPELAVSWYPYIELEDYTSSVNGHNVLGYTDSFEDVFFFQAKLRISFIKKTVNWWDVPVRQNG